MKELIDKIENLQIERAKTAAKLENLDYQLDSLHKELEKKQSEEENKMARFIRRAQGILEFSFRDRVYTIKDFTLVKDEENCWKLQFECDGYYILSLSSINNLKVIYI